MPGTGRAVSFWCNLARVEDRLFTERRLRLYASGAVVGSILAAVLVWCGLAHGEFVVGPDNKFATIDFCWMWVSGKFAASSDPVRVYDPTVFSGLYRAVFGPAGCIYRFEQHYDYPPTFLFFTYPLGLLSYLNAFVVWIGVTFIVYVAGTYAILPRVAALVAATAPFTVLENIHYGHNGLLTAGLMGLALAHLERRPWLSGVFLGLLTYKPQFGVLFPLVLLASRNWRALASATAASLILAAVAAIAFGPEGWPSFVSSLFDRSAGFSPDQGAYIKGLQSIYGLLYWLGAGARLAAEVQAVISVVVAIAVCAVWAKPVPYALKAAILCFAVLMVTPYALFYDLCILSVGVAFLVNDGLARGFLPGERVLTLACFVGLFGVDFVAPEIVGPVVTADLLCIAGRRVLRRRPNASTTWRGSPAATADGIPA